MLRDKSWWSWKRRSPLYLWIGERHVQLGRLCGGRKHHWEVLAEADVACPMDGHAEPSAMHDALRALETKARAHALSGQELRVVVADIWVCMTSIPWSPLMAHQATARMLVTGCLEDLGAEIGSLDEIRVDDAPYGAARLAIAYPAALLTCVAQLAGQLDLRCTAVRPVSVLVWDCLSREQTLDAAAIVSEQRVILALGTRRQRWRRSRLSDVKVESRAGLDPDQCVVLAWQRWTLRHPQAQGIQSVQVLDATHAREITSPHNPPFVQPGDPWNHLIGNPYWLNRFTSAMALDAMVKPSPRRGWHWALLGMAGAVTVALVIHATNLAFAAAGIRRQLAVPAQVQPARQEPLWTQDQLKHIASVNEAIRQLNLPVEAVMQALRPPRDIQVAVIAVETANESSERADSTIKITAEALTSADMTRYVAFVADRKPFVRAYLMRHEIPDEEQTRFRFLVEAKWVD